MGSGGEQVVTVPGQPTLYKVQPPKQNYNYTGSNKATLLMIIVEHKR